MSDKIQRHVIVRSRDAGVIFGDYIGNDGSTITLANARQMWLWRAKKGGTLIDCATHGVVEDGCRFSFQAAGKTTVFNACAMIDCTADAAISIREARGQQWI